MLLASLGQISNRIIKNKILKKIIAIIMMLYILFSSSCSCLAATELTDMNDISEPLTVERAGNYVANFAINFEANFAKKSRYTDSASTIEKTYNAIDTDEKYYFTNASWIAFAYAQSLKLESNSNFSALVDVYNFVTPHTASSNAVWNTELFEEIKYSGNYYDSFNVEDEEQQNSDEDEIMYLNLGDLATNNEIQPGDIIIRAKDNLDNNDGQDQYIGKVFLYVGAGLVIYCEESVENENDRVLRKIHVDELNCPCDTVLRIKEDAAAKILDTDATMIFAGKGFENGITYQGIPSTGTYIGTEGIGSFFRWIIDVFADILDYYLGYITYAIRLVVLGWVGVVENFIHAVVLGYAEIGEWGDGTVVNSLTGKSNNLDFRISVEDIIYNRIPILDVNFFSLELAGQAEIADNSPIGVLRTNIARWYYIIRLVSIVAMLLILIYVGIRIAITSTGQKKAQYKSALTGWVVAFLTVIAIHLIIYVVFVLNEYFVSIFQEIAIHQSGSEIGLYETIRTKAYALKFTEGFASTVIYIYMVYLLVRFLMIYFKRYITVTILALMGPIIGLRYAIQRATGKKAKSISTWIYELIMNVFIQTVHAMMYACFMTTVLEFAFTSLAGYIVGLVILSCILKADKIFMKIFQFDRAKSFGDTRLQEETILNQFVKLKAGILLTKGAIGKLAGGTYKLGHSGLNLYEDYNDMVKGYEAGTTKKQLKRDFYAEAGKLGRKLYNTKYGSKISSLEALSLLQGKESTKKMDEAAFAALTLNYKYANKSFKRAIKTTKAIVGSGVKVATAIPIGIDSPMTGIAAAAGAISTIKSNVDDRYIKQTRFEEEYKKEMQYRKDGYDSDKEKRARARKRAIANSIPASIAKETMRAPAVGIGMYKGMVDSVKHQFEEDDKKLAENAEKIKELKDINNTDENLEKLYQELKAELQKVNSEQDAKQKADKMFMTTAKEAQKKRIGKTAIKGAIEEFMSYNNLAYVSESDVEKILNIIKRRESELGKELQLDTDVMENIRKELNAILEKSSSDIEVKDMQKAIQKGLEKRGSIKSEKVDNTKKSKVEDLKAQIQEQVRRRDNLYESSGKKVESTGTVLNRIKDEN